MKNLKEYVKPMKNYFIKNKEKDIKESKLCNALGLTASQVRYVIADLRYDKSINVCYVGDKTYTYTTKRKNVIEANISKINAQLKEKAIKRNILKRYI